MKKNTTIRTLENKAAKGDVRANYQLFETYRDGLLVEEDRIISEKYYNSAINYFKGNKLTIAKIKLSSYRIFRDVEINFPKAIGGKTNNLSVIVGNNGAGKTSILEAVANGLNFLTRRIIDPSANTKYLLDEYDINKNSLAQVANIFLKFEVKKDIEYELTLSKSLQLAEQRTKSDLIEIRQLADLYRSTHIRSRDSSLPMMAFYSVKRSNDIVKKDIYFDQDDKETISNILDGYRDAFDGYANFKHLFVWLKNMSDIANSEENNNSNVIKDIERIKSDLNSDLVKGMVRDAESNEGLKKHLNAFLAAKQDELDMNLSKLNNSASLERKLIGHVTQAIAAFMSDFENLRIQRKPYLDLLVDKEGVTLSVLQLSQGEKSLMALVSDIARRLVILNPSLENPLAGNGIILIDEIDLHLHPSWQQTVIPKLLSTFPNIQFIITTHSPQVLTTVDSESIRILDSGVIYNAPKGSKGAEASRLLKRIFKVDPRPKSDENTQLLLAYESLVYQDQWASHEARKKRVTLNTIYSGEEPKLTELDLYIENRTWELDLEEDK